MRKSKDIKLYVPKDLLEALNKALEVEPPKFKVHHEYFIHVLVMLDYQSNIKKNQEYYSLSGKALKAVTSSRIRAYVNYLVKCELIECDNSSIVGEKSFWYRINPKFEFGYSEYLLPANTQLGKRLIAKGRLQRSHYSKLGYVSYSMLKKLKSIEVDWVGALEYIKNDVEPSKQYSYFNSLNRLYDKRFLYFKRNRTNGRLDTNLTNLPSGFKKFFIGDYVSIDLRNSQPFFLSVLIDKMEYISQSTSNVSTLCVSIPDLNTFRAFTTTTKNEVSKIRKNDLKRNNANLSMYKKAVTDGVFYDEFAASLGITREEAKDVMFGVLFSQNQNYKSRKKSIPFAKEKRQFNSIYPFIGEVVEALKGYKKESHKKLAIALQQMESSAFIDSICFRLVYAGIMPLTIHDSVIVEAKHQKQALEIMQRFFRLDTGIVPSFEITKLNSGD